MDAIRVVLYLPNPRRVPCGEPVQLCEPSQCLTDETLGVIHLCEAETVSADSEQ